MKLENEFVVSAPLERTWVTLLDIERVATCLPGAAIEPDDGNGVFRGVIKMKLGPVAVEYKGTAQMLDVDEEAHVATLEAKAREAKGQGTAAAQITNRLAREGNATRVTVETELNITGRQAQFGRGIMQDVSEKMLGEFAKRLEQEILSSPGETEADTPIGPGAAAPVADAPAADAPRLVPPSAEPLDLGGVVSGPLLKRALPVAGAALSLGLAALAFRGRRRRGLKLTLELG